MANRGLGMRAGGMLRAWLLGGTALLPASGMAVAQGIAPNARPTGGAVVAGSASIAQGANRTTVTQSSQRAAVEWQQFNVGSQQSVQFVQPNAQAATLNRVVGPDPSVIAGRISATTPDGARGGMVAIVNQSGVVFANGSQVSVGSLIASAANITNQNFMAGQMVFDGAAKPGARVENHGTITVADRGLAALVGPRVGNTGRIQGRLARVALQGGAEAYSLDLAGDGMLAIDVTSAVRTTANGVALATNSGIIEAPGGSVLISAHAASGLVEDLVRNTGRISANTAGGRTGQVALRAEGGNVRIEGTVEARGSRPGQQGGSIAATATGGTVTVAAGARVDASGQAGGGTVQIGGRTTQAARVEGRVTARSRAGQGGRVAVQAADSVTVAAGARVDVSGATGGGTALVGTEGLGRNQVMAARTTVERGAAVRANATRTGNGGTIAVNSTQETTLRGHLGARGGATGGDGGFVEVSSLGLVVFPDMVAQVDVGAPAGQAGTLLLDPRFIVIDASGTDVTGNITQNTPPANGTTTLTASSISGFSGNLLLEAERGITLSADVDKTSGTLTLRTTQNTGTTPGIFIEAGLTVAAGLTITSAADIAVTATGGKTGAISTSTLVMTAAGGIALDGTVAATTSAVLTANGGAISQSAVITTPSLAATASTSVTLTQANQVDAFSGGAGSALAFTSAKALGVNGGGISAADVALDAPSLALFAPVTGTNSVALNASTGDITQTAAGTITTASLTATAAAGAIALSAAPNQVAVLTNASALNALALRSVVDTEVQAASGQGLTLVSGGALSITGAATAGTLDASVTADALTISGGGSLTGATVTLAPFSANTSVSLGGTAPIASTLVLDSATLGLISATTLAVRATGTGGVRIDAPVDRTGAALDLQGASISQATDASIKAATLRAVASGGAVDLNNAPTVPNEIGTVSGSARDGFALSSGTPLTIGTGGIALTGTGTITLRADQMTIGDRIAAPGGVIDLAPISGIGVTLGAAGLGLSFDGAALALLGGGPGGATSRLRIASGAGNDITIAGDVGLRGRIDTLELQAGSGSITQSLGAIDVGRVAAGASGGVALAGTGNAIDEIAVASAGSVSVASAGTLTLVNDTVSGINGISGTTVTLASGGAIEQTTGTLAATTLALQGLAGAGSTVGSVKLDLPGNQIVAMGAVTATSGDIAIRSDVPNFIVNGFVLASAGDVALTNGLAGGTLTLNSFVQASGSALVAADNYVFGLFGPQIFGASAGIGPGSAIDVYVGPALPSGASGMLIDSTLLSKLSLSSELVIGSALARDVILSAPPNFNVIAPQLRLVAGRNIQQSAPIIATNLQADAGRSDPTGSVELGGQVNAVSSFRAAAGNSGSVSLLTDRALSVGGIDAGGLVFLGTLGGNITQTGIISGSSLTAITNFGSVVLDSVANQVAAVAGSGTTGFRLRNATGFDIGTPLTNAVAGGAGAVSLTADTGAIRQVPGSGAITGTALTVSAGGAVDLAAPANTAASVQITAGGDVAYAGNGSFVVAGIEAAGQAVTLESVGGTISQSARINAASLRADAPSGNVLLAALTNSAPANNTPTSIAGSAAAAGSFAYRGTGGVAVAAPGIDAGTVQLTAAGGAITQGAAITATTLSAVASGAVDLASQVNAVAAVGGSAGAGTSFAYRDTDGFSVSGISVPGGTITLTAGGTGAITQSGALGAATLDVTAGGAVTLGLTSNTVANLQISAGGDVTYRDADGFDVTGISAPGRAVTLSTTASDITQSGGITAASLSATATSGAVILDDPLNAVGSIAGSAPGGFTFVAANGFTVTGIAAPGGDVALTAGAGDIAQSPTGVITGATLAATANAGTVNLAGATNAAGTVAGSARDGFAYQGTGSFVVDGITVTAGSASLVAVGGGITQGAPISAVSLFAQAATGAIDLSTQQNVVGSIAGLARDGFAFRTRDGLVATGLSVTAGPAILISDTGSISQTGLIGATQLTATATNGSVLLGSFDNAVAAVTATANGGVTLQVLGGMQVLGIDAGGVVDLTAKGGDITQSGQIKGSSLAAAAPAGAVVLDGFANTPTAISGTALSGFAYRGAGAVAVQAPGISTTTGAVQLQADGGGITQGGAAPITGDSLGVIANGAVTLQHPGNAFASLGGTSVGSFAVSSSSGFDISGIGNAATTSVTLGSGGAITQSGPIRGTALTVQAGGPVTLTSAANTLDSIDITAGGDVGFLDSKGFVVARIDAAGATATLEAVTGDITQSGDILAASLGVTANGGVVDLARQTNTVGSIGGAAAGSFAFGNSAGFVVHGITAGTTVTLDAASGILGQSGIITATALVANAPGDSVQLGLQNAVAQVGGTAPNFTFANGGSFSVTGIASGNVDLTSTAGSIGQSGAITSILPGGATLRATAAAPGQSVALDGVVNGISAVRGSADQAFALLTDQSVAVGGITTAATGTVDLHATQGDITQTGLISTGGLRLQADAGGVDLTTASNQLGTLAGTAATTLALFNAGDLAVGTVLGTAGLSAPTVDLHATGSLTQSTAITATGLRVRADTGAIALTASNQLGSVAGSAAGDIRLTNAHALTVGTVLGTAGLTSTGTGATTIALTTTSGDLVLNGGNVTALGTNALVQVNAAGSARQTAGTIATRRLQVQAGAGVQLGGANQFDQLIGATVGPLGGVIRGQSYTVTGPVTSGGTLALEATGPIVIGSSGSTPAVTSTGGGLSIISDTSSVVIGASPIQALAGDLLISGPGGISLTGGSLSVAGVATLTAGAGGMALNALTASVGSMAATALGNMSLTGVQVVGGVMGFSTQGNLSVTSTRLTSGSADPLAAVTLGAAGAATVLTSQVSTGGRMNIVAQGPLSIDLSSIVANTAYLAGSAVTLGSMTASIGSAMLVAGPFGITNVGPMTVNTAVPGQFPMVIYDTRTVPLQTANAILGYVQPDLPGLQPDQQPTQLRSSPGSQAPDPFFGLPVPTAAGNVSMNIQAGSSPVMLLLDGGTATGTIVAGRLLVHGTGGKVDLQGTLGGLTGAQATQASDISRPVEPTSLSDYRINSCVISSINCVVTPRFQPIPPAVRTNVEFAFRQNAFNPADVIIPNTGENDYE